MNMENNNLENTNEGLCDVFDSHEDAVNRVKGRMPSEEEYDDLSIEEVLGEVTVMKDEDSEEELIMSGEIIFNKK